MKITLDKANKLRNKLESMMAPTYFYCAVTLRSDEDFEQKFTNEKKAIQDEITRGITLISYTFNLRGLIGKSNQDNGINDIINEISATEKLLRYLKTFHCRGKELSDFRLDAKHNKNQMESGKDVNPISTEVNLLDVEFETRIKNSIRNFEKTLEKLKDTRNAKNYEILIEIPKGLEDFLRKEDLI